MTMYYEVDHAMLGQSWQGNDKNLKSFCKMLQERCDDANLDIEIVCITFASNGACHTNEQYKAMIKIGEVWNETIEYSPDHWWNI